MRASPPSRGSYWRGPRNEERERLFSQAKEILSKKSLASSLRRASLVHQNEEFARKHLSVSLAKVAGASD